MSDKDKTKAKAGKKSGGQKSSRAKKPSPPAKSAAGKPSGAKKKSPKKKATSSGDAGMIQLLEEISEELVFAEPSDYKALADLHTKLGEFAESAKKASMKETAAASGAAVELLEQIILEESSDPAAALETVGRAVAALQEVVRDGRSFVEVGMPEELSESADGSGTKGLTGYRLPSHLDESILQEFLSRQESVMDDIEELILTFEKAEDEGKLAELKRALHTLKGESALLGISDIETLCHATEDMLGAVRPSFAVDTLLTVKDWLAQAIACLSGGGDAPCDVAEVLGRLKETIASVGAEAPEAEPSEPAAAEEEAEESALELPGEPRYLEGDTDLLADFVSEARDHLDAADVHLLTLETEPEDEESLNAVFRAFHTIKGVAGFLALDEIGSLSHEAESLLDKARKGEMRLVADAIDVTFDAVDTLKRLITFVSHSLASGEALSTDPKLPSLLARLKAIASGRVVPKQVEQPVAEEGKAPLGHILVDSGAASMASVESALERQKEPAERKRLGEIVVDSAISSRRSVDDALESQKTEASGKKIGEILVSRGAATSEEIDEALEKQSRQPERMPLGEILVRDGEVPARDVAQALRAQKSGAAAVKVKETLKVDADRLDRLVDMIGELVIAESMVSQSEEVQKSKTTEFSRHLRQLDKITRELQEMGTSLRMVPVRATFSKMARLVRDLSRKSGKPVEFNMSGEDTELDKSVVDRIGDPLVHMVRNSIDHGIEGDPEDRVKAGKPRKGNVHLRAFHKGGSIFIEIEDDGRGLDREAILNKAIERGLIKDGDSLSDREVYNLIFEPGFSTAKKITDVSGRGVGMDVVRRNIEALRGQVEIRSEPGKGSVFTLRLPLTLAIIDGMVVRVGGERYIIPTLSIVRSIQPKKQDMTRVLAKGEMLTVQGELMPLFRLGKLFRIPTAADDPTEALAVVVEDDGKHTALVVDELLGQQQIVIKSLGEMMRNSPGIAGGAIMPDGNVGLILDIGGLVRLAHSKDMAEEKDGAAKKEDGPARASKPADAEPAEGEAAAAEGTDEGEADV